MKRVLSYGGGLDSFAMLVDAAQRGELPDAVVFCDVGDVRGEDPGEWPSTMRHIHEVAAPLCDRLGVPFHWLHSESGYTVRGERSLFAWMEKRGQIPVSGPNRICTIVAKVERFEAWLDDTYPGEHVEVWIGFEAGEETRAANDPNAGKDAKAKPGHAVRVNRFPLIERGLCRCRCERLVRAAGLPVPRKSACTFCPYGTRGDWQTLADELPDVFGRIERLEADKMSRPTKRSKVRLSIMGYRKKRPGKLPSAPVRGVHYVAPTLREYIAKPYRPKGKPCPVCGAAERATKATGCSYLDDNHRSERAAG